MPMPGIRKYVSGRPRRPGLANKDRRADRTVGQEHVALGRLGQDDGAAHPHEVGDTLGVGIQFQEWEHQHAAHAVADPVHAIAAGLALDVVEDRRHVVPHQVVDVPRSLAPLAEEGLPQPAVDPIVPAGPRVLARAPDVEDVHVVASSVQLGWEVIVRDRPEGGIEAQPVTEDHRQLGGVGLLGPIVADTQPPSVRRVSVTVRARTEIGARRLPSHGGATRQPCAHQESGAERPRTTVHEGWNPSRHGSRREHPCSTAAAIVTRPGLPGNGIWAISAGMWHGGRPSRDRQGSSPPNISVIDDRERIWPRGLGRRYPTRLPQAGMARVRLGSNRRLGPCYDFHKGSMPRLNVAGERLPNLIGGADSSWRARCARNSPP